MVIQSLKQTIQNVLPIYFMKRKVFGKAEAILKQFKAFNNHLPMLCVYAYYVTYM